MGWLVRQDSIQSTNEALIARYQRAAAVGIHYDNPSLFRDTSSFGWPPSFPVARRVTIVVITIIIAYCLGWEDFFLSSPGVQRK